MKSVVFYLALTLAVLAASFSAQIPPDNNPVKTSQPAKKGKKKHYPTC